MQHAEAAAAPASELPAHDHRRLGRQLGLFASDDTVGAGLPLWLPAGAAVRRALEDMIVEEERRAGYLHVYTPPLAKPELFERSGHADNFADDMFPPIDMGGDDRLQLRPVNCPHHLRVYTAGAWSYRDLPMRIAELGDMFRRERSGVLGGLSRVRCMTLNDAHIFCRPEQLHSEIGAVLDMIGRAHHHLGIEPSSIQLSLRGEGGKYLPDEQRWARSEDAMRAVLAERAIEHHEAPGEAAFYGPKIDIQIRDAQGREETISTVQVDFQLPERFGATYIGEDGKDHEPVLIHRSIVGTMERMVAHLVEHHKGALPVWLAPTQVAVLPVSDESHDAAALAHQSLLGSGVRSRLDDARRTVGARIREATMAKVPYIAVVGERESAVGVMAVRDRAGDQLGEMSPQALAEAVSRSFQR